MKQPYLSSHPSLPARLIALTLTLLMVLTMALSCAKPAPDPDQDPSTDNPAKDPSEEDPDKKPDEDPAPTPDKNLTVRVTVLSGTTGFGVAPLMQSCQDGNSTLTYQFSVENDASLVTSALIKGDIDIAALPTNAAATLYQKTKGGVQLLAINTLGVLYLVDQGHQISSMQDLKGKTVYVPAQNPTFIFKYLCEANGLKVGEDVIIDNSYTSPAELQANVAAGTVTLAVLPEPMVTITRAANPDVSVALDLTAEWNKVSPENSLVQGCLVVRTEFAQQHPVEVNAFLEEYRQSVNYLTEHVTEASEMIAAQGIFAKAAVAAKAIPNCNICYMIGKEAKTAMEAFVAIMLDVQPASVGGASPEDDFYYIPDTGVQK